MHVIGQDASLLRNGSVDTSYWTNTLYIGPGEARDVLFDAPAYAALGRPGRTAAATTTSTSSRTATGAGCPISGRRREPAGCRPRSGCTRIPLPAQTVVSQTYV